jgi:hypothetical protein
MVVATIKGDVFRSGQEIFACSISVGSNFLRAYPSDPKPKAGPFKIDWFWDQDYRYETRGFHDDRCGSGSEINAIGIKAFLRKGFQGNR